MQHIGVVRFMYIKSAKLSF